MKRSLANFTFSEIPNVVRPRSTFDRGRTYKTTFDAGYLIPFYCDEILPGDTVNLKVTAFARLMTLIVPILDNIWLDFFFFFVPNRLVWDNWVKFCGQQDNPTDSTDFLVPNTNRLTPTVGSLYDYFGLPIGATNIKPQSLPFRAYNLIWNEFFRDENLQNSVPVNNTSDGPDATSDYVLLKRGKRKADPFTSALPWPQKGPGVELPIGGTVPVVGKAQDGTLLPAFLGAAGSQQSQSLGAGSSFMSTVASNYSGAFKNDTASSHVFKTENYASGFYGNQLFADLSHINAVTINSMREAFQVQKWYEQLARGGSRYNELVLSMFGVSTGDARLQRPEYLGGGHVPVNVHAVAQTSSTDSTSPQGNLSAYAIAGADGIGFSKSFVEHGHVIGLVSVRADYNYQQGLDRMWSRQTKFDFYWPAFAHLGEVPVLNKEIYCTGSATDDQAFGYQERWYEYRYGVNKITGKLRSGVTGSLDVWHLAQEFANLPTLNSTFIEENPPISRVIAVQNEPQFLFDSVIHCRFSRVMPVYSTPGLIDHF